MVSASWWRAAQPATSAAAPHDVGSAWTAVRPAKSTVPTTRAPGRDPFAEAGPGTQTPRSAADDAGAAAAPIAPADLESPQEESAAPEVEAIADEALLDSARAGDESSYAALYERHRSTALNVARMHTRNVHDAEDLVSEAFARILSVLRRGGGGAHI